MAQTFPVYKDGDPSKVEHHTRANANDLVNGAGYTWKPRQAPSPVVKSPYQGKPATAKTIGQQVLDSAGGANIPRTLDAHQGEVDVDDDEAVVDEVETIEIAEDEVVVEDAAPEAVIEDEPAATPVDAEPVEDEPAADEVTEDAGDATAAPRRGRPRKNA